MPGDRFFRLFSQLYNFSLSSIIFFVLNSFAIWASFYLQFFFSHILGKLVNIWRESSEIWTFFVVQEGRRGW